MTRRTVTIIVIAAVATLAVLVVLCGVLPLGTTKANPVGDTRVE
jgi:hypothetical protein